MRMLAVTDTGYIIGCLQPRNSKIYREGLPPTQISIVEITFAKNLSVSLGVIWGLNWVGVGPRGFRDQGFGYRA